MPLSAFLCSECSFFGSLYLYIYIPDVLTYYSLIRHFRNTGSPFRLSSGNGFPAYAALQAHGFPAYATLQVHGFPASAYFSSVSDCDHCLDLADPNKIFFFQA
ncbi:hypothetical protein TNCT_653941 [Trichonephila clavata]|uniref:Uncharacterized protein n=1 Tax=Trichonephila clavata TaxID=2740835 RepID=A0A8X6H0H1_TRICU|nr:hypothetical protein TNCT_653941 [Trichonephila clavata]